MSTKRFLGYDTDETGKLVINRTQEPIVIRLYQEFLDGKTTDYIKRIFEREGVKNWDGGTRWQSTTLMSMLENEKYKGDALLQKSYTVDFLTKKRTQNKGENLPHRTSIPQRVKGPRRVSPPQRRKKVQAFSSATCASKKILLGLQTCSLSTSGGQRVRCSQAANPFVKK